MPLRPKLALCLAALLAFASAQLRADPATGFRIPSLYHVGYWVHDVAKSRAFYSGYLGFAEPYDLNHEDGTLQMVVMKVNERQVIYIFADATKILPNGDNLDHLGLEVDNAEAMRTYLLAQGVKVGAVHRGHIGDLILGIKDPDGHTFEVTQLVPEGQLMKHQGLGLPESRVSDHLDGALISVSDLARSLHFYVDILGFKRLAGQDPSRARVQVPDGTDFLDLQEAKPAPGAPAPRGVPAYYLGVADMAKALAGLSERSSKAFPAPSAPSVGPDGTKQASLIDPDGTRVILRQDPR